MCLYCFKKYSHELYKQFNYKLFFFIILFIYEKIYNLYFKDIHCHLIGPFGQKYSVLNYEDFLSGDLNEAVGHK